jgi:NAD-dependent dihydropyrimidine dehydrogenase PreA subunit
LSVAKDLVEKLEDYELISMAKVFSSSPLKTFATLLNDTSKNVGFIFPMYYWGLPQIVYNFIEKINLDEANYIFAIITRDGDEDGVAFVQLERILSEKSRKLNAAFFVQMPNNYIIGDILNPEDIKRKKLEDSKKQINLIYQIIKENREIEINIPTKRLRSAEKQNSVFRENVLENDKFFYADEKCNSCGICEKVCPVNNIILVDGKPQWQHKCQQCLACIHYCPEVAIQYSDKTLEKGRYHHPEITIKDLINQKA